MTDLEVKGCVVSNLRTGEMAVVRFGRGEAYPRLFPSPEDTHLLVEMDIGEKDRTGTNLFSLQVASVEALHFHHLQPKRGLKNKHLVFPGCDSWERIESRLTEIICSCNGYSFADCCEKLRQHFDWEYEQAR